MFLHKGEENILRRSFFMLIRATSSLFAVVRLLAWIKSFSGVYHSGQWVLVVLRKEIRRPRQTRIAC